MKRNRLSSFANKPALQLFTVLIVIFFGNSSYAKNSYSFGIVPQQAASKLARTWAPVLSYLEKHTGYKLSFSTAKNIPVFEENLAQGKYDFAYMNPHHYVVFHKHSGYKAFAKARDKKIHGILVVHKDSSIRSVEALHNKVLAFPSPLAFGASLIPRSELARSRINITPRYVLSHDSVYRNVAAKNFVAGGGVMRTFKATSDDVRNELRILYKTKGYTPHAFAAHPDVPTKVSMAVLKAMRGMNKTTQGKNLLKTLKIKGISSAKNRDWDDVRKIRY